MNLSDIPDYRRYARSFAFGDASSAESALLACLEQFTDGQTRALILHFLAGLYAIDKNKQKCLHYYELAEQADQHSPQPAIFQIQFMSLHKELQPLAIEKAANIRARILNLNEYVYDEAMDKTYYLRKIDEIISTIKA